MTGTVQTAHRRPGGRAVAALMAYVSISGALITIAAFLRGTAAAFSTGVMTAVALAVIIHVLRKQINRTKGHCGRQRPRGSARPAKESPIDIDPSTVGESSATSQSPPTTAPTGHTGPAVSVNGPPHPASTPPALPAPPSRSGRPPQPTRQEERPFTDEFPRPSGSTAKASHEPWRLPTEPGPAGIAADAARLAGLDLRAASIVGPAHRCEDPAAPRQDAYRIGVDRSRRFLLIAVADGMSDSSHSHIGANVATSAVVQFLWPLLSLVPPDQIDWRKCFTNAAGQMAAAAKQRDLDAGAVRAVLLTAVVELVPDPGEPRRVWLAWIADVSAWCRSESGWQQVAGTAKSGPDANRLSEFLPFHPQNVQHRMIELTPGAVLAVTSDGIGDVLGGGRIANWFAHQWAVPPPISDFIQAVGYEAKGELDDRTAVVVWCGPDRR
jgi:hypothetical protein